MLFTAQHRTVYWKEWYFSLRKGYTDACNYGVCKITFNEGVQHAENVFWCMPQPVWRANEYNLKLTAAFFM